MSISGGCKGGVEHPLSTGGWCKGGVTPSWSPRGWCNAWCCRGIAWRCALLGVPRGAARTRKNNSNKKKKSEDAGGKLRGKH